MRRQSWSSLQILSQNVWIATRVIQFRNLFTWNSILIQTYQFLPIHVKLFFHIFTIRKAWRSTILFCFLLHLILLFGSIGRTWRRMHKIDPMSYFLISNQKSALVILLLSRWLQRRISKSFLVFEHWSSINFLFMSLYLRQRQSETCRRFGCRICGRFGSSTAQRALKRRFVERPSKPYRFNACYWAVFRHEISTFDRNLAANFINDLFSLLGWRRLGESFGSFKIGGSCISRRRNFQIVIFAG